MLTRFEIAAPGFFGDPHRREWLVVGGMCLLLWLPSIRCPTVLAPIIGVLASASLYIYLTGYQVYPHLERHPWVALVAALGVGILYWTVTDHVSSRFRRRTRSRPRTAPAPRRTPAAGAPPAAAAHRGGADRGGRGAGGGETR
ncbi:hypothetical protein ACWEK5_43000 [Rhodococcus koreensis]